MVVVWLVICILTTQGGCVWTMWWRYLVPVCFMHLFNLDYFFKSETKNSLSPTVAVYSWIYSISGHLVTVTNFPNISTEYSVTIYSLLSRVHNISSYRGRVSNRPYTLYKCTVSSNTSKLSYTLGFNLRVIMDDTTVKRWW